MSEPMRRWLILPFAAQPPQTLQLNATKFLKGAMIGAVENPVDGLETIRYELVWNCGILVSDMTKRATAPETKRPHVYAFRSVR
jgi:hypothetical protein